MSKIIHNLFFLNLVIMLVGHVASASSLTLFSSKRPDGKRYVTITKTEITPSENASQFVILFHGSTIENSTDIKCDQDLTPFTPFKFISPIDQSTKCQTSIQNVTQLHCPTGLFETRIIVVGSNCDQYVDVLSKSEVIFTASVIQDVSLEDLVNVKFVLK